MKEKKDQRVPLIRLHAEKCRKNKFVARPDLPARQKMLRGIDLSDENLSQLVVYDAVRIRLYGRKDNTCTL